MNIRYVGRSTIRELGPYRWGPENGYVVDVVEPAILEEVLTYPKPDFVPVDDKEYEEWQEHL